MRADGSPEHGFVQLTFALYAAPSGGAPLWSETRSVGLTESGAYSTLLGELTPLPALDGALWLGITVLNESEMAPRVPLAAAA